jgi:hypothetical protein
MAAIFLDEQRPVANGLRQHTPGDLATLAS